MQRRGGYAIATDGDSVNLAYPNSKTRRGRVGKEVSQTLQCNDSMGVTVIGNYMPSNHEASRIVDNEGIAPTVKENHGTVTAIVENKTIEQLEHEEMLEDDIETLEKAIKSKALERHLETTITDEVYEEIRNVINNN